MMCVRNFFIVVFLLCAAACSNEGNTVNMKEKTSSKEVQEKVDSIIGPQLNALKKAKALEGKLKTIEQNRLNTIENFDQ